MNKSNFESNFEAYNLLNVSRYKGQWVAVVNKKIVSSGPKLKEVHESAKKISGKSKPLFAKVPREGTMIL